MVHKIHMGSQLPSVKAGKPYQIGGGANPSDWSTVVFPADPRRCESCHDQNSGAAQADAYLKNPSRAACGACHDNVNFATGENHVNLPQATDNQCTTCHNPQGELEFDASIKGAHTIPQQSATRPGIVLDIVKVENGGAGQKPTVTFTVRDFQGNGIPMSAMSASPNRISLNLGGPTTDFGYTSFGSDVTTPGYVTENPVSAAKCSPDGTCSYTFTHAIPANAKGTYAIGIEGRRGLTILPGTVKQLSTQYGASQQGVRTSRSTGRRSRSAARWSTSRSATAAMCRWPCTAKAATRPSIASCAITRAIPTAPTPAQAINFSLMVHKIHYGENMQQNGATYKIGSSDFSDVRFPVMSNTGHPGDTAKCYVCHVNGSESVFPIGLNPVKTPQGLMTPMAPTTAACTACHVKPSALAHAHVADRRQLRRELRCVPRRWGRFSVAKVHAGK